MPRGGTVFALAACGSGIGATAEERFNEAKQPFSNYTVHVTMGDLVETTLKVENGKAEWRVYNDYFSSTGYFKVENGIVYEFSEYGETWSETSADTIEEAVDDASEYQCGFSAFSQLYFDDFEEDDDSLVMTDNALASFSSLLGYDLVSCRLRMDGARFASVTVIVQYDGRMEMAYAFSDYGSTSVQLPA